MKAKKVTKTKIVAAALIGVTAITGAALFSACGEGGETGGGGDNKSSVILTFTSDSSSIDEKAFDISVDVNEGGTLSLTAECTGAAASNNGPGGFPDFGGGDFPDFGDTETETFGVNLADGDGQSEEGTSDGDEETIDYTVYNFTATGTWTEESGWGYTFILDGTTLHVNYDVYTASHYFYYAASTTIDGNRVTASSAVKYSAEDTSYQKKLASDYETYEAKNCVYHFYGGAEGASGNLNVTDLYLLPDGKAADFTGRDTITYTDGTWVEDSSAHTLTVTLGDTVYEADYTNKDGKAGYRINKGSYNLYASCSDGYEYYDFTDADFDE